MLAVVTGATGFLGTNLAIELVSQGHKVRALYRRHHRLTLLERFPIELLHCAMNQIPELCNAFREADAVFHCAALVTFKESSELTPSNVEAVRSVISAVRAVGVRRLIHCSSVSTIGVSRDGVACTEDRLGAQNVLTSGYTRTKRIAEGIVSQAVTDGIDAIIVNPSYMLGPYGTLPGSMSLVTAITHGIVPTSLHRTNNFVDVRDVARGMIQACDKGRRGERYILGGDHFTCRETLTMISRLAGVYSPVNTSRGEINLRSIEHRAIDFLFSSEKAKCELAFRPSPVLPAIADGIRWLKQQGML